MSACLRMLVTSVFVLVLAVITTGGVAAAAPDRQGPQGATAASANGARHASDHARGHGRAADETTEVATGDTDGVEVTGGTAGDVTAPQPVSNADANDGGANGQCPGGPYCSTRDGSPSQNGAGDGKATGKPCAGCVGKADNKNPAGQMPNGSDHNAGYECDRNQGVGKSNPAHTGCTAAEEPPVEEPPVEEPPVEEPPVEEPPREEPPVEEPPVLLPPGGILPPVEITTGGLLPEKPVAPALPQAGPQAAGVLPATGSPAFLAALLMAGVSLVGSGGFLLLRRSHG